jgi:flagellar biosynthesis protein FlhB
MADSQKTEQPTQRRLKKAREEGNFVSSRQFMAGTQFLAFVTLLRLFGQPWLVSLRAIMASTFQLASSREFSAFAAGCRFSPRAAL